MLITKILYDLIISRIFLGLVKLSLQLNLEKMSVTHFFYLTFPDFPLDTKKFVKVGVFNSLLTF